MEIVVRGRHLTQDVGDSFREHCQTKLERLGRLDHRLRRLDVELSHEPNPRQAGQCQRVEITVLSRGPVVRAESSAKDCYAAFEGAFGKLEERMRRAASRRMASHSHSHHGQLPVAVPSDGSTLGSSPTMTAPVPSSTAERSATEFAESPLENEPRLHAAGLHELDDGLIVREKIYSPEPMDLDEAVHRMELVGHDFYLFCDSTTGTPSVVYKRRGYDYGVLRLAGTTLPAMHDVLDAAPTAVGGIPVAAPV